MTFASGKQVNFASGELKVNNTLNHHWCETSLLPQAVLKHVMPKDFFVINLVHVTSSVDHIQIALVGQQA